MAKFEGIMFNDKHRFVSTYLLQEPLPFEDEYITRVLQFIIENKKPEFASVDAHTILNLILDLSVHINLSPKYD